LTRTIRERLRFPAVVAQWREHLGTNTRWRVKHVIAQASAADDFHAALLSVASDGTRICNQRLGTWLSRVEGLTVDGLTLVCAEVKFGYAAPCGPALLVTQDHYRK
jgi:hypothetical protein